MAEAFIRVPAYAAYFVSDGLLELCEALLTNGAVFVAEADGLPVETEGRVVAGMLALYIIPMHPLTLGPVAEEIAWWVEPGFRRHSVGEALLLHLEHWCRENAISVVKMVAPAGTSVGNHYQRHGYVELETAWMKVL